MKIGAMPPKGSVRISKGFLVEADDLSQPVLCREIRGFPAAIAASKARGARPERLVFVIPDLAMDDWLEQWSTDVRSPRRKIIITRRIDGAQVRLTASLLTHGYGVDTAIRVEKLDAHAGAGRKPRVQVDIAQMFEEPDLGLKRRPEGARRRRA
jgi:hypothetical protein